MEHTSFVSLVLACTGGPGPSATTFIKRLAAMQAKSHYCTQHDDGAAPMLSRLCYPVLMHHMPPQLKVILSTQRGNWNATNFMISTTNL